MINRIIDEVEKTYLKETLPVFRIGDTVDVHCRIREGEKERVQIFSGVVIARSGRGINENITVRRLVKDEGVERIFPLHSPNVLDIQSRRRGKVRRAKLFYLRDRVGKARKLREVRVSRREREAAAAAGKNV